MTENDRMPACSLPKAWTSFVCFLMCQHHPIPVLCAEGQRCSLFCQSAVTSSSWGSVPSTMWRSTSCAGVSHNTCTQVHTHFLLL